MKYLTYGAILLGLFSTVASIFLFFELNQFKCDSVKAVFAEREYTYPILRSLGYNPDDYGKNVLNPITSSSRYVGKCE